MRYLITLIAAVLFACSQTSNEIGLSQYATVISNVNVVDVRSGTILPDRHVIVDDQKIKQIVQAEGQTFGEAEVIDGTGMFLCPGLVEMHAHIPSSQWGRDLPGETLFLYLSNGVTTIRGMLGHPEHLQLREDAKTDGVLSPRIFTSSPSINGNSVPTVEKADEIVRQYKDDGYDFLKLHPGLKLEVFNEVVATGNEVGIGFSGHVSTDVGVRRSIESGYGSIDHIDGFLEGLVPQDAGVDPSENGFFGYNFTDLADRSRIDELMQLTVQHEVWVVPTQSLFDRWFSPQDPEELAQQPEMKYMPRSMLDNWVDSKRNLISGDNYDPKQWEKFNSIRMELIKAVQDEGQGLLLGSDAPQVFNVPGFSIHHELEGMIRAGLTPAQALRAGTLNPAVFFDMEGSFGEIVKDASADLILVSKNPLEDISNLRDPLAVMFRGAWMTSSDIEERLAEIAERVADQ